MSFCKVCNELATKRCSRCRTAVYCSVEHQKVDWPEHKLKCQMVSTEKVEETKPLTAIQETKPFTSESAQENKSSISAVMLERKPSNTTQETKSSNTTQETKPSNTTQETKPSKSSKPATQKASTRADQMTGILLPNTKDKKKLYEWFIDCFRMRMDDDCCHGGVHRSIYDEGSPTDIAREFLVFCHLSSESGIQSRMGSNIDWPFLLKLAADEIAFAFEKEDAKEKYGGENVFTSMLGSAPSLRLTAEVIYGFSVMEHGTEKSRIVEKWNEKFRRSWQDPATFSAFGGQELWQRLVHQLGRHRVM